MTELSFPDRSFDLIWSEGTIYVMGFEHCLMSWMRLLKPLGALAVTEITWLDDVVAEEPRRFWQEHYRPLERRLQELRRKYQGDAPALTLLDGEQQEIDLYRRYPTSYGYVFYLMRTPD